LCGLLPFVLIVSFLTALKGGVLNPTANKSFFLANDPKERIEAESPQPSRVARRELEADSALKSPD
jgi:hypothetical protein